MTQLPGLANNENGSSLDFLFMVGLGRGAGIRQPQALVGLFSTGGGGGVIS